jgi:hypothetical protein
MLKSSVGGRKEGEVRGLDGRLRRRMERHYGCRERVLLVLLNISSDQIGKAIELTSFEACHWS